jgi:cephalosporin-C deacetylase
MMKRSTVRRCIGFAVLLLLPEACRAQEIAVTPSKPAGVYDVKERIEWHIEVTGPDKGKLTDARYTLKKGEWTLLRDGTLDLSSGSAVIDATLDDPGTVLLEIKAKADGKEIRALGGAVAAPDKIQPSAPRPDDFDAFWASKIQELKAIPANAQLEPADGGRAEVEYFKVRMDNIHGSHIHGQLARPKGAGPDKKYPAMLIVQYAGVYGLPKTNVTQWAARHWIALNIMAHDLPFDQPEEFYKKAAATTLNNYAMQGAEDRDKSYFLRMLLGCYQAADYLAGRDDWDGKTLVVTGTSQGGYQTLATAALYPKITAMMANVPGGCDVTAADAGRAPGWPYWYSSFKGNPAQKQVMETARYYDAVNFASRIKCPALVSMGLIDETCPAAGVMAAFNQIPGEKEEVILPHSDHHGTHNAQAAYFKRSEEWAQALAAGKPVPVAPAK